MASAVAADGRSVTSKISASSASSQVRTGVPRKTSQWAHSARHASRDSASVSSRLADAERLERHPAGVEQPRDVVVGRDEQRRRVGERAVVEQQARVDVPVGRDDRQRSRTAS